MLHRTRGDYGSPTEGWDDWTPEALPLDTPRAPQSPVTLTGDVLAVRLPSGLSVRQFHNRLNQAIRATALHRYAGTAAGAVCCALRITPAERLCRATNDPLFGGGPVEDLHLFDPGPDLPRLIAVVERIIVAATEAPSTEPDPS